MTLVYICINCKHISFGRHISFHAVTYGLREAGSFQSYKVSKIIELLSFTYCLLFHYLLLFLNSKKFLLYIVSLPLFLPNQVHHMSTPPLFPYFSSAFVRWLSQPLLRVPFKFALKEKKSKCLKYAYLYYCLLRKTPETKLYTWIISIVIILEQAEKQKFPYPVKRWRFL